MSRVACAALILLVAFALTGCQKRIEPVADGGFFPPPGSIAGWDVAEKPVSYDRKTLFEYIDGEAELFLQYGFQGMQTQTFRSGKKGGSIVIDVYRFSRPLDAFGAYSRYRVPRASIADVGAEAFSAGGLLAFYKGGHFVKVASDAPDTLDMRETLAAFARFVASRLPGSPEKPKELRYLPLGKIAGESARYYPGKLLGIPSFPGGLTCSTRAGGKAPTLFIAFFKDEEAASKGLDALGGHLVRMKGKYRLSHEKGRETLRGNTGVHGGALAAAQGKFLIGCLGVRAMDERACQALVEAAIDNVRRLGLSPPAKPKAATLPKMYEIISQAEQEDVIARFSNIPPHQWGVRARGIITRIATSEKVMALTFDACGDTSGDDDYDRDLIAWLEREKIPATLFLGAGWVDRHAAAAKALAREPLFEIANHGFRHRPLSVTGNKAYGISGTRNAREVVEEIVAGAAKIKEMTGDVPHFFRSGTAHCDDVAVEIAKALGFEVVNFTVNGDEGASLRSHAVRTALLKAPPGAIVIFHMNRPGGGTAEGLRLAVPELRNEGFRFVRLSDCTLK